MIKIKINKLSETENIADYYGGSGIDMRTPDRKVGKQIPTITIYNTRDIVSHDQTAHTNENLDEEFELDEDLLYEKKDRCYHLAKQKYDVFPSAYASGFIAKCRAGKVSKKRKKK